MVREDFLLERDHEALRLARNLFNYRDAFSELAGQADKRKLDILMKVAFSERTPSSITSSLQSSRMGSSATTESRTDPLLLSAEVRSLICPDGAFLQGTTVRSHLPLL